MQIFVRYNIKTFTLDVESSTTIKQIKDMLEEKPEIKLPMAHYELKFRNNYNLDDDKTLADYNVRKEDTLLFLIKSPNSLKSLIKIKLNDEMITMSFSCFCCYSILDYKKEIYKRRGYPIECQLLYSDENGINLLEDDDKESKPVLLKIIERGLTKGYRVIYFDYMNKYTIIIGTKLENIYEIKEEIEKNYKLPKNSYELVFDNNVLSDKKTLSDYNIFYESEIKLYVEKKYEKLLFKNHYIYVKYKEDYYTAGISDYTILGIKQYFNEFIFKGSVEIKKIKIIFRGIILDDDIDLEKEALLTRQLELIVVE